MAYYQNGAYGHSAAQPMQSAPLPPASAAPPLPAGPPPQQPPMSAEQAAMLQNYGYGSLPQRGGHQGRGRGGQQRGGGHANLPAQPHLAVSSREALAFTKY